MKRKIIFDLHGARPQPFSLPKSLIAKIIKDANSDVSQKLLRTCKYFYLKAPYFIVDSIHFDYTKQRFETEKYDNAMDFFNSRRLPITRIWVTKKMFVDGMEFAENMVSRIIKCTIEELHLSYSHLALHEFKRLTNSGTIKTLILESPKIFGGKTKIEVPIEGLLACVPTATNISLKSCPITPDTMEKLIKIPWKNKIQKFCIEKLNGPICVHAFHRFAKAHVASDAMVKVTFDNEYKCFDSQSFKRKFNNLSKDDDDEELSAAVKLPKIQSFDEIEKRYIGLSTSKKISTIFNENKNIRNQNFPFRQSLMNYILKNGKILKKLYQTCKYFYWKYPFCILDGIYCDSDTTWLTTNTHEVALHENNKISNIWILKAIQFAGDTDCEDEFFNLMSKVVKCDAKEIEIFNLKLPFDLFKKMTKSQKVLKYDSEGYGSKAIIDNQGNLVPLENLLCCLTSATVINLSKCHITPETMSKLAASKCCLWKNKITELSLSEIDSPFDEKLFYEFIKKVVAPRALIKLDFAEMNQTIFLDFKTKLNLILSTWKPRRERPSIIFKNTRN